MFMLDHWEALLASGKYHTETLTVAQQLADEMCASLFERMGLSTVVESTHLRVSGRGLTYLIPLRGTYVPLKEDGRRRTRSKKGLPVKKSPDSEKV